MSNQVSVNPTRLCQRFVKFRMPDKLRVVEQLAKLCGFNEQEKREFEHGFKELIEVIARRRRRGAGRKVPCQL